MKKMIGSILLGGLAWNFGVAGFAPPTPAQIDLAAKSPAFTAELVRDASAAQAATVVRSVIMEIIKSATPAGSTKSDPREDGRTKNRIAAVIRSAFENKTPEQARALARELGNACGNTVVIAGNPQLISWIQESIASVGGPTLGTQLAQDFGGALILAVSPSSPTGIQVQNQNQAPPPPEPRPYPAQE